MANYRLKLHLSRITQKIADLTIWIVTFGMSPEKCYLRVSRLTAAVYPFLSFLYRKSRPVAHHSTFRSQLFKVLLSSLQKKYSGYNINLYFEIDNEFTKILRGGKAPVILSPHIRLTTMLGYFLDQQGYSLSVVANSDPNSGYLNFGMKGELGYIKADRSCLIQIRQCIRSGTPVLIMPDYERGNHQGNLKKWISPSIFFFISKLQCPAIFMWVDFDENGCVRFDFKKPTKTEAMPLLDEFIGFIQERTPWDIESKHPRH